MLTSSGLRKSAPCTAESCLNWFSLAWVHDIIFTEQAKVNPENPKSGMLADEIKHHEIWINRSICQCVMYLNLHYSISLNDNPFN